MYALSRTIIGLAVYFNPEGALTGLAGGLLGWMAFPLLGLLYRSVVK